MTATASRTTNRRPELLAPAGGPEPFAAALAAGADAIYCGMGSFNARRKATNFTDEAFEQACRAAHLAGSRVYVTVNIVIKQSEMGDALQLIHRCSTLGADAFIIQDWGLFFEVKRTMSGIETHISTQANIHDDRGTLWCREQGADRVTLAFLVEAYDEEVVDAEKNDVRVVLHLHPALAPYKAAVLPLSKKLSDKAREIYAELAKEWMIDFDETGSIGKRYRREDEVGTPYCITVDFDTVGDAEKAGDNCVTVRERDTMEQVRVPISELKAYLAEKLAY